MSTNQLTERQSKSVVPKNSMELKEFESDDVQSNQAESAQKLMEIHEKLAKMRKDLDDVNTRFANARSEIENEKARYMMLTGLKLQLENQQTYLKGKMKEVVKRYITQLGNGTENMQAILESGIQSCRASRINRPESESLCPEKLRKENCNKVIKLRNQIETLKMYEKTQKERLSHLKKLRAVIMVLRTMGEDIPCPPELNEIKE